MPKACPAYNSISRPVAGTTVGLLATVFTFGATAAEDRPRSAADLARAADAIVEEMHGTSSRSAPQPGFAVGVYRDGRPIYKKSVGQALLDAPSPISSGTVFSPGSITKQFTAYAAHLLVAEGKLALDTDVRPLVPSIAHHPVPITLDHLIHHTNGLKDVWWVLHPAGLWEADGLEQAHFIKLIGRHRGLNFTPGTASEYSNSGYTVLAEVVASASGASYGEYLRTRIFEPLGMRSASVHTSVGQITPGAARAYQRGADGVWKRDEDDDVWREVPLTYAAHGTTNLRLSIEDFGPWFANLGNPLPSHAAAVRALLTPGRLHDGSEINYAGGLFRKTIAGHAAWAHGGHDQEFYAQMAFFPEHHLGIVVLANSRRRNAETIERLARLFLPAAPAERATAEAIPADPATIASAPGAYLSEGGLGLRLQRADSGLLLALPDGTREAVTLGRDGRLQSIAHVKQVLAVASVDRNGRVIAITHPAPPDALLRPTRYGRVAEVTAASISPDRYVGRYYSLELDTIVDVRRSGDSLAIENRRSIRPRPMSPLTRDVFTFSWGDAGYTASFHASLDAERASGFTMQNVYANDVEFVRVVQPELLGEPRP